MAQSGKVSVIMGVYNCEKTLTDSIESVLSQTYDNFELIICDDGSTDRTYDLLERYKNRYPDKIILLKNEKNMHLANALNRCLSVATGEYIARMDGDDKCLPERFEKQVEFLTEHPGIDLCSTAMQVFYDNGETGDVKSCPEFPEKDYLKNGTPFNHAAVLCKKSVFDELHGYTELKRTVYCEDQDLWFRFFAAGMKGANLKEALYLVRVNPDFFKRRTVKTRINWLKTRFFGLKLLHFPFYCYITAVLSLAKIFVPKKLAFLVKTRSK